MPKKIALYGAFNDNMLSALREKCPAGFEVLYVPGGGELDKLSDAEYMINRTSAVDAAVFDAAPALKWVQKWGVGYDKINTKIAGERGIPVGVCIGGNSMPVAELTVTMMLDVLRNVIALNTSMKLGESVREKYAARSYLLHGKTVGLIGIGNIARKVADIVHKGFDANVIYYDIFRLSPEQEAAAGVSYRELDELMAQADLVSVHVPLLETTRNIINAERIALMKPTACIINTSRGGIVDEAALLEALKAGRILGAGLDTFAHEPVDKNSELLRLDCVTATPHSGGNTVDNDINMAAICMECISKYDSTGCTQMREIVNPEYFK